MILCLSLRVANHTVHTNPARHSCLTTPACCVGLLNPCSFLGKWHYLSIKHCRLVMGMGTVLPPTTPDGKGGCGGVVESPRDAGTDPHWGLVKWQQFAFLFFRSHCSSLKRSCLVTGKDAVRFPIFPFFGMVDRVGTWMLGGRWMNQMLHGHWFLWADATGPDKLPKENSQTKSIK